MKPARIRCAKCDHIRPLLGSGMRQVDGLKRRVCGGCVGKIDEGRKL